MFSFLKFEYSLIQIIQNMGINDDFEVVKTLLENTPDALNKTDKHGQTPVIWAVKIRHINLVKYLISKNADLNVVANDGHTALSNTIRTIAPLCATVDIAIAKDLILAGALDFSRNGRYFFHQSIDFTGGDLEVISLLLEKNPDFLNLTDHNGRTPLMMAVRGRKLDTVNYFISRNANLNVIANDGYTALYWAYEVQHYEILHCLIQAGALDTLVKGKYLIHLLAIQGNLKAVTLLLEKQPNLLNKKNTHERTPLEYISQTRGVQIDAVRRLLIQAISTQAKNELEQERSQTEEISSPILPLAIPQSIFHRKQIRKIDVVDKQEEFSWVNQWS